MAVAEDMRLVLGATLWGLALCCSYVEVPVPDAKAVNGTAYVIGRTNELGGYGLADYRINVHPRGEHGGKYGYVAVEGSVHGAPAGYYVPADGMNEKGLTMGIQTLRESEYEKPGLFEHDVLTVDVVASLLRNCATVDEALEWLSKRRVVGPGGPLGFHWAMADANGRSVVVEYLKGQRIVYENTPRVMTNDPPLDWHWRNLNSYVNLGWDYPHQNDFLGVETEVGTVPKTVGNGWNLAGLPGDGSPPSRYVQLFYLRGYALKTAPPKTVDDAIVLASGLLNKIFIPLGTFGTNKDIIDRFEGPEYTPFGLLKIPTQRRLLVRAYRNIRWRQVDLTLLDFSKSVSWPVEDGTLGIEDITDKAEVAMDVTV